MKPYDIKRLALVLAIQAEIEGMKAENTILAYYYKPAGFTLDDFKSKAAELRTLAYSHDEQLI